MTANEVIEVVEVAQYLSMLSGVLGGVVGFLFGVTWQNLRDVLAWEVR